MLHKATDTNLIMFIGYLLNDYDFFLVIFYLTNKKEKSFML